MLCCYADPGTEQSATVVVAIDDEEKKTTVKEPESVPAEEVVPPAISREEPAQAPEPDAEAEAAKRAEAEAAEERRLKDEEAEKQRQAEEQQKEADRLAAAAAEPEAAEPVAVPKEEAFSLPVQVREPGGAMTTVHFVTKPLGMEFARNVRPVKISKVYGHAKALEMKPFSELVSIGGVSVEEADFAKMLETLKEKIAALPAGMMLGFAEPGGSKQSVVFPTKPLGIELSKGVPMTVSKADGAAQTLGVKVSWQLESIAGKSVEGKSFADTLGLLKELLSTLPEAAR